MVRKLQALEVPGGGSGGGVQTGGKTPESLPSSNTGWDPRSPTLEYNRTPLALGEKKANIMANNAGGVKNEDSCEGDSNVIEDVDVIGKKLQGVILFNVSYYSCTIIMEAKSKICKIVEQLTFFIIFLNFLL